MQADIRNVFLGIDIDASPGERGIKISARLGFTRNAAPAAVVSSMLQDITRTECTVIDYPLQDFIARPIHVDFNRNVAQPDRFARCNNEVCLPAGFTGGQLFFDHRAIETDNLERIPDFAVRFYKQAPDPPLWRIAAFVIEPEVGQYVVANRRLDANNRNLCVRGSQETNHQGACQQEPVRDP